METENLTASLVGILTEFASVPRGNADGVEIYNFLGIYPMFWRRNIRWEAMKVAWAASSSYSQMLTLFIFPQLSISRKFTLYREIGGP